MADTYTLISSVTVGAGGASSIDFTSIPATYTDLLVNLSVRVTQTGAPVWSGLGLRFNADSGANYSQRLLYGDGSAAASASSSSGTSITFLYANKDDSTTNTFASTQIYVPNYGSSNQKSVSLESVTENNAASSIIAMDAGLWTGTSAINQLTITPSSGTFKQYSTAYLYGIKNS